MRLHAGRLMFFILAALLFSTLGFAQSERSAAIDAARSELSSLRTSIDADEVKDSDSLETRLRNLRDESRARLGAIDRELDSLTSQIDALGPAPGENDPPEIEDLAAERKALNDQLARLNSQKVRVNANIIEAGDLLAQISTSQVQRLYKRLLTRGESPLAPSVWRTAIASGTDTWGRVGRYFSDWSSKKRDSGAFGGALAFILLAIGAALLLFGPVHRWIMQTFSAAIEDREATPGRRVLVAGLTMLARAAPGLIGGFIVIETLKVQGVLTDAGRAPANALWFGLIIYLLVSGFLKGLLAPKNPAWRIAPVDADRGKKISLLINAVVLIFGAKILLQQILIAAGGDVALINLLEAVVAIIVSVLLFLLCRSSLWRDDKRVQKTDIHAGQKHKPQFWRIMRRVGRGFALTSIIAALAGYVGLANFAASRLYYLSIILAFAWFIRAALLEGAQYLWRRQTTLRGSEEKEEREHHEANVRFWNGLVINTLLIIAAAPAVLVLAGTPANAVADLFRQALFGFHVGGIQVPSLFKILVAIGIFVGIMGLTRIAQKGFKSGPFAHSQIDSGVQNSLITLIGYAGLLIALFASVSAIGFDLSNLALIAGALSVGIGFGLQSIVNNFVSGLILLFERPIKVGDWVVTASGEGIVQRISVRSTEIETFDRSSIIVPNSELISSTVTNWTHKNRIGRIIVPVGVAYGSDAEQVKEILLKCAKAHPLVVSYPESFVVWQDFGASSLDFELRCFLADISKGLSVRSELRFAINKAFAEAGIEIPFPQRDIHVKSWPSNPAEATQPKDA